MRGLRCVYTVWLRDFKVLLREPSRTVSMIGQPLLYLLIVGQGIASGLTLNRSEGNVGYLQFMYPGILGMSVLFTCMFSAISIIWDREFGFLKEVLVAPVPRWAVALGKVMGGATTAMFQAVILIALGPLAGVTLSVVVVLELLLICFLISVAMTSLGVCIAAGMRSMQGFQMVMNFLVMPLYFLSGAMFPIASAPPWMKALMTIDPLSYGVDALRNVVFSETLTQVGSQAETLAEVARGAGLVRWPLELDVAVMALLACLLAAAAAVRFSRAQ
jgi:ABC-2 type transport system permease protein